MAVISTAAVVLHTFPYGESSKIVRLATRDHGVLSAIAKGAQRAKSRFGAHLQLMSDGTAQLYLKQNRELQTLAAFDVEHQRMGLTRDIGRYASASALAELILRFAPQEPQPHLYALLTTQLDALTDAEPSLVAQISLGAMWLVVSALGFTPSLDACAVDGCAIDLSGRVHFSVMDGGYLCPACAADRETSRLESADREWLQAFVGGADGVDPPRDGPLPPRHAAAHRRLVSQFIRVHVAEGRELKALHFWETQRWNATP